MTRSRSMLVTIIVFAVISMAAPVAADSTATTVTVTKTAVGFNERITLHNWNTASLNAAHTSLTIEPGQTKHLVLITNVARTAQTPVDVQGVRGVITVTNTGEPDTVSTVNLRFEDQIIARPASGPGGMRTIVTASWTPNSEVPALADDNVRDFNYEIQFETSEWTDFRNTISAYIDNNPAGGQSAHSGELPFTVPTAVTDVSIDATAALVMQRQWLNADGDPVAAPHGVTLGELKASVTGTTTYISALNISMDTTVARNNYFYLRLTPAITGDDTGTEVTDDDISVVIEIYTGETHTTATAARGQGYWRNHTSSWSGISPSASFYASGQTWLKILCTPPQRGDAYYILARQFIAASLNNQAGVPMSARVQSAFISAAAYFTAGSPGVLTGGRLSTAAKSMRKSVLNWAELLDSYNDN